MSIIFIKSTINHGVTVFKRMWSVVDFLIILFNLVVIVNTVPSDPLMDIMNLRIIEAFLMIMMWFKSLYYIQLIGEISPLVDMIFIILTDIGYFMIVYAIGIMAFINAYKVIGLNQVQLGRERTDDSSFEVDYSSWKGAAMHVYLSSLGEFNTN